MIKIEVKLDDKDLVNALGNLVDLGHDTTPIMRRLAGIMASATEKAFDEQRDPVTGAAWAPLSRTYAEQREAAGHAGRILQLSGSLAASVSREYGNGYARVGTNKPFAAAHQFGAATRAHIIRAKKAKALRIPGLGFRKQVRHPGSNIPARPFLGVGPEDVAEMEDAIKAELTKAIYG